MLREGRKIVFIVFLRLDMVSDDCAVRNGIRYASDSGNDGCADYLSVGRNFYIRNGLFTGRDTL